MTPQTFVRVRLDSPTVGDLVRALALFDPSIPILPEDGTNRPNEVLDLYVTNPGPSGGAAVTMKLRTFR